MAFGIPERPGFPSSFSTFGDGGSTAARRAEYKALADKLIETASRLAFPASQQRLDVHPAFAQRHFAEDDRAAVDEI
jgi:hypothetical protein